MTTVLNNMIILELWPMQVTWCFFYLESDDIAVKRYHIIIDNIISNNCHWLAEIRAYLNHPHKCNILFSIDLYKISLRL